MVGCKPIEPGSGKPEVLSELRARQPVRDLICGFHQASGQMCRTNRPSIWLHPTALPTRQQIPCQRGASRHDSTRNRANPAPVQTFGVGHTAMSQMWNDATVPVHMCSCPEGYMERLL
jgi:hypothetical protein